MGFFGTFYGFYLHDDLGKTLSPERGGGRGRVVEKSSPDSFKNKLN